MKRVLLVAVVAALALGSSAAPATGAASPTKLATVAAAGISLRYPATWLVVDPPKDPSALKRYFKRFPQLAQLLGFDPSDSARAMSRLWHQRLKVIKFLAVDVNGDGDNVLVSVEPGAWYSGLEEWQAAGKASAEATHGEVLASDETHVGSRQAFTHLEQYDDPPGHPVIYGYMEVRKDPRAIIEIAITVDGDQRRMPKQSKTALLRRSRRPTPWCLARSLQYSAYSASGARSWGTCPRIRRPSARRP